MLNKQGYDVCCIARASVRLSLRVWKRTLQEAATSGRLRQLVNIYQLSTFNFQLSTFNFQLSTLNSQLSTLNFQLSTFNFQFSTPYLVSYNSSLQPSFSVPYRNSETSFCVKMERKLSYLAGYHAHRRRPFAGNAYF